MVARTDNYIPMNSREVDPGRRQQVDEDEGRELWEAGVDGARMTPNASNYYNNRIIISRSRLSLQDTNRGASAWICIQSSVLHLRSLINSGIDR